MRGAAQSLTAAASGFVVVVLLAVPVVQGQDDWGVTYFSTQICALEGSTVEINSFFSYPSTIKEVSTTVQDTFWFRKEIDGVYSDLRRVPEYSHRATYHCNNRKCTLTIENLMKSDSGVYKFRFITNQQGGKYTGEPGVTLSVTDLQIQVNVIQDSTSTGLNCHSSCHLPGDSSYIWYKNEREVHNEQGKYFDPNTFGPEDNYRCAVKGRGDFRSPPVYPPKFLSVSVSPSGEIVEGSSVTLTCSSDANPEAKYTWYKENQTLFQGPEGVYHFTSINSEDSGTYYCKCENHYGQINSSALHVDVQYAPKLLPVSVSPSGEIVEGSSVNLTCSCDANPAANYTWYKENQTLFQGPEGVYHFTSINSEDSGTYYCKCENHYGQINSSALHVDVQYAPKLLSVSVSPSGEIVEGSSVNLTCSSDANPAANYTWYKENQKLFQGPEGVYHFTSINSEDRGTYYCKSENHYGQINSSALHVDVQYAPKLLPVSVSPSGEIVEGSSVNLTCSCDANPAANYTWYKENEDSPKASGQIFTITDLRPEHSGNYYCEAQNTRGRRNSTLTLTVVEDPPKFLSVSVSPSGEIVEGSSVTLTCSSDANPAANYTWYKENQKLFQGPEGVYHFTSINSEDRGTYYCKSENHYGQINSSALHVDVQYAPKLLSVSVSPSGEIVEGSSVNLTCSSDANPAANYTWYKENEDSPKASGQIFTITDLRPEHSGNYYCEAQNTRGRRNSTLTLTVVEVFPKALKSAVIGTTSAVFLAVILLSAFLLIRAKRTSKQSSEPGERPDYSDQYHSNQSEEQVELHYASVRFLKNQTDPVYSNINPAGPRRHEETEDEDEDEDGVHYAVVKFNSSALRTISQETEEDPAALYSTVNKTV
ncbi:B-cell receptor CD22-like [Seriola aureovittata]|uniref:B-cell receptor CD22-like n=1 Tax=Seriola aureovittata TaxID=2871759 RepID=UPI0024BE8F93|nr:B-cell receptor CD22-like [Seriola aureovittata]